MFFPLCTTACVMKIRLNFHFWLGKSVLGWVPLFPDRKRSHGEVCFYYAKRTETFYFPRAAAAAATAAATAAAAAAAAATAAATAAAAAATAAALPSFQLKEKEWKFD